jgi:RNA polymerase sigma-70 factor (ECF subfamily)
MGEVSWLEPYPDALFDDLVDAAPDPVTRYESKEAIALSFVTALQHLPPRQRAVLVLREVLGFVAAEVAEMLDSSEASVNSALQRARATLDSRLGPPGRERAPLPRSPRERAIVERFVEAFANDDIDAVVALLTEDALLTMPPEPHIYEGREAVAGFLLNRIEARGGKAITLIPTRANGQPAFGFYIDDPNARVARCYGVVVLTLEGDRIAGLTRFRDSGVLALFGLPRTLQRQ